MNILGISASTTTPPPRCSATASSSPRPTRSASPASATTRTSRSTRSQYCLERGRHRDRRPRLRRLLRQAVHQVRAHPDHLPRDLPALAAVVHEGDPGLAARRSSGSRSRSREKLGYEGEVLFAEHHQSHAASALPAVALRGGGDPDARRRRRVGDGDLGRRHAATSFELIREIRFPHSLGLLYSAFTYYLGFKVNSAEYKVMGAGALRRAEVRRRDPASSSSTCATTARFKLDMKYFAYDYGLTMTNERFAKLFGQPRARARVARWSSSTGTWPRASRRSPRRSCCAMARDLHATTGMKNLCMAGGVALNCVANGRIVREGPFENLSSSRRPATRAARSAPRCSSTTACSASRARSAWTTPSGARRTRDDEIRALPRRAQGAAIATLPRDEMLRETARQLDEEQAVVGWFQGRMEWGPRALGARSILADARNRENWTAREPEDQVPRELPALRAGGARGEGRRVVRPRPREPVHAARLPGAATGRDDPGGHARRRLGAHPDGDARRSTPVLRPARRRSTRAPAAR